MEFLLSYIRFYLRTLGFQSIVGRPASEYRELNAVGDMNVMLNAQVFIGDKGSTFSEMVVTLRNNLNLTSVLVPWKEPPSRN